LQAVAVTAVAPGGEGIEDITDMLTGMLPHGVGTTHLALQAVALGVEGGDLGGEEPLRLPVTTRLVIQDTKTSLIGRRSQRTRRNGAQHIPRTLLD
jgi:hypothetical protein